MKKLSILLLTLVSLVFLGLHGAEEVFAADEAFVETFENAELTGSYADGSFVGNHGVTWTYVASRDENGDANNSGIDGNAIMLRRSSDNSAIKSSLILGGISYFEVKIYKGFTGSGNRQVEVFINDVSIGKSVGFNDYDEHVFIIENLEIEGDFTVEIKNIATNQVIIDDITWKSFSSEPVGINATVNQMFGVDNNLPVPVDAAEYGQDITIPVALSEAENQFQFGLVNGVIKEDFAENNTFPITDGLEVSLVYGSANNHAVLFVDSNGKLLSHTWVADGENAEAPSTTNLSKPGYALSSNPWLSNTGSSSLDNINSSRVYTLQYELDENPVQITVNGNTTEYAYNQIVTVTSDDENNFKAWTEDGRVVSTNPSYTFTALTDRVLVESTVEHSVNTKVVLSDDLKLRSDYQSFVGQLNLTANETLVEFGLVLSEDGLLRDLELTLDNGVKAKSEVLVPATNEFLMSVDESYLVVRAYVVIRDQEDNLNIHYSDNQYNDVAIVTFDSDGGSEIEPVAIKKGTNFVKPADPVRPSHDFLGWFVGEDEFDFDTEVTEDLSLIANWLEVLPTIFEVRALSSGTAVEFKGIVTGFDGLNMFVQDETAAINVYRGNLPSGLVVGDEVRIVGSRAVYSGLQQIGTGATVTIETRENQLPTLLNVVNLADLSEDNQSMRVSLSLVNLTVQSQSGNNLTLTDGISTILVYASSGTDVYTHIQDAIIDQRVDILEAHVGWYNGLQLTIHNVDNLIFVEPSDVEKLSLAEAALVTEFDEKEFNMETEITLPETGLHGVAITWSMNPTDAIADGKWKVVTEDTQVTLTATLTLGENSPVEVALQVTIKFVDASEPGDESLLATYDFTMFSGKKGTAFASAAELVTAFNSTTTNNTLLVSAAGVDKIYQGNGTGGGADENNENLVKTGTGSANGTMELTFAQSITKVELTLRGWATGDTVSINGVKSVAIGTAYTTITIELTEASTVLTFLFEKRALITGMKLFG